jgi:poly-gamma-glutamate synthesis protein (capsule biosynthesis protein)
VITIGAIGDIMMMSAQVNGAYNPESDSYDFSRSFQGVANQFRSVDLMCGNFESTLAGKDAGYSIKKRDNEPADTFNAPDTVIDNLKDIGFDFLSTGNNHCLDREMPGLLRTLDVLDEKGIYHTGTARSNAERDTPLIIDVKGVKIGFIAPTEIINKRDRYMNDEETQYAVTRLYLQQERLVSEIKALRAAGADFIVAYPHWDKEHKKAANSRTREAAKLLFESGVDVILGSHPHVVQSIEYMTVERDGQPYTGLVVYSMGKFISNMSNKKDVDPLKYGLYVQLTIEKALDGKTTLKSAEFMPLMCFYRSMGETYLHQVVPALSDTSLIRSFSELTDTERARAQTARDYVIDICTTDAIPVMDDADWMK